MSNDLLEQLRTHLEFLGYSVELDPEDWNTATHPRRFNFYFRADAEFLRMICQIDLGPTGDVAWQHDALVAINELNESARLSCYTLAKLDSGEWVVRLRALLPATYNRESYGLLLDTWHDEQGRLNRLPPVPPEGEGGKALH